jgi:PAS domain S-box-containing protein
LSATQFLTGDGTLDARIRAYNWSDTPLGPLQNWPQVLLVTLSNMLRSKFPTYLVWGPELTTFYNDACLPLRGVRQEALGQPLPQAWAEVWKTVSPIIEQAYQGRATYVQNTSVAIVQRGGYPEETWWTASFSPVVDETGKVGGVLIILQETTERILTEKRLRFLVDLSTRLRGATEEHNVTACAAEMLGQHLRAGRVGYAEVGESGASFTVGHEWTDGSTVAFAGQHKVDEFGASVVRELNAGLTVCIDDASVDPRTSDASMPSVFVRTGQRAAVIAPLIRNGLLVALIYVQQEEPRRWRNDEAALIQEVAERTWTSILRARAETALRRSEERFRQFADHSSDVLWIVDAETMAMEYVSPAYERVWGRSRRALQDRNQWIETIPADDRERVAQVMQSVLQGETVVHEYRIVRPGGSMRRIHATIFPIFDEPGRVRRVGGIARDVTRHDGSMVYVVDREHGSRRQLSLLLQNAGYQTSEFPSEQAFLDVAPVVVPGCVVLRVYATEPGELQLPRSIKSRRTALPVVVIGEARGNVHFGVQAMKAGAIDFLDTPHPPEQLLEAVASAQASIDEVAERDQAAELVKARIAALSVREREVLDGLLSGGTNKTIARELGLSPRTVEAHRARIMERLGAGNLPELVQIAMLAGLEAKPQGEQP